ncbi:phospholipase D-like domain-containing protein [Hydrogenimonas cancrithermarum]|nr:phospholipase D-like domain-containing protein [Hydrogenimonas cancrithermarum]
MTDIILTVGAEVLIVLAFLHMLSTRRAPSSMIAWTLAIFLVPYFAVPFYFLFGQHKLFKRYQKLRFTLMPIGEIGSACRHPSEKLLCANAIPPASSENSFVLIDSPLLAYREMEEAIVNAESSIDLCIYKLELDEVTETLSKLLEKRAQEGVKVRLLLDSIGSANLYLFQKQLSSIRAAGVQIAFFMPFLSFPVRNFINLRNHRKIFIFDNHLVMTGGMNLSKEYLSPVSNETRYDDILCKIEGTATHFFSQIFEMDWSFATHSEPRLFPPSARTTKGTVSLQVAPSGPDTPSDGVIEALLGAICNAKERIWIFTPYFVPNEQFVRALAIAVHRGVDVKIVVPEHSDHLISDLGRGSYLRELHAKGADVRLFRGGILHAKAIVFDHDCALVGSINFDNRSLFYNFEASTFIYSPAECESIATWGMAKLDATVPFDPTYKPFQIRIENMMRMLAPLV